MISPRDSRRKPPSPRRRKSGSILARIKQRIGDYYNAIQGFFGNRFLSLLGSILFPVMIIGMLVLGYFAWDLPDISTLDKIKKTPAITIKAESGEILGTYGDIYGEYVGYKKLPPMLVNAVIATEDRSFFDHHGIDMFGMLRAMLANMRAGKVVQGGSTITQQLAKNLFLTPERTMKRKIQEIMLAFKLETRFTKQQIMTLYLNRVYLGAGNFGVDAASRRYFKKPVQQLTLNEAAILTGLLKAPSRYAPTSNPVLAQQRAKQVILNMIDAGMLTEAQAKASLNQFGKQEKVAPTGLQGAYYFTDWILEQIPEFIGNVDKDITIVTTLNPSFQKMAETSLTSVITDMGPKLKIEQGALVSMSQDGAIRAMVGGMDYTQSQFNRATQALRQPGSSFKLFVYLAGLEAGLGPDAVFEDKPVRYGKWAPKNYTGRYLGPITLRTAFAESVNTVAVQVAMQAGVGQVVTMAKRLGINSPLKYEASIALGTNVVNLLELTGAYAHLAANGNAVLPYAILTITDTDGKTLYHREGSGGGQLLSPYIVNAMNEMLIAVVNEGTGQAAQIGRPAAGKTGTSQDFRDAWFIGFVPQLVTGVWVGNDNNSEMAHVTGGKVPAIIWKRYMQAALQGVPAEAIPHGSSGNFLQQVLPWLNEQGGNAPAPQTEEDNPVPRPRQRDVDLTPGFWDKLFEAGEAKHGEVEYEYPENR